MLDELLQAVVDIRLAKARECLKDAERSLTENALSNAANRSYYCIFLTEDTLAVRLTVPTAKFVVDFHLQVAVHAGLT